MMIDTCMCKRCALSLLLFCRICMARLDMVHCSLLSIPVVIIHGPRCILLEIQSSKLTETYSTVRNTAVVHFIKCLMSTMVNSAVVSLSTSTFSSRPTPR